MSEVSPAVRQLARQLLLREAGERREPAALAGAAERACERLRRRLVGLLGRAGVAALFGRALHLAQAEVPALAGVTFAERSDTSLQGVREFAATHDPAVIVDALAAILAHVIGLLAHFIGADLGLRLVGEAWPEPVRDEAGTEE